MPARNNREAILSEQEFLYIPSGVDKIEIDNVAADRRLAAGPIFLKRGPFRRVQVPLGTVVLITQGNRYVRKLHKGSLFTFSLPLLYRLEQYVVYIRERSLILESKDDFRIKFLGSMGTETPVSISVSIKVEYQVIDPEVVVFAGSINPVAKLYDHAFEETRAVINALDYDTFINKGPTARVIRDRLQALNLEASAGITVTNVSILSIEDNAVVEDIRAREFEELARIPGTRIKEDERREQERLNADARREQEKFDAESKRLQEWLDARSQAGIARMTGQDVRAFLSGDRSGFLNQQLSGEQAETQAELRERARVLVAMLENNTLSGIAHETATALLQEANSILSGRVRTNDPKLPSEIPESPPASLSGFSQRLIEDVTDLEYRWNVTSRPADAAGLSIVIVNATSQGGQKVTLIFQCFDDYPTAAPSLTIVVERQPVILDVDTLGSWAADSHLLDIVLEVLNRIDDDTNSSNSLNVVPLERSSLARAERLHSREKQ